MEAPKYFLFLNNFSKKLDNRALIDDLLTFLHKLRYFKLPQFCIQCYHHYQHLILLIFFAFLSIYFFLGIPYSSNDI